MNAHVKFLLIIVTVLLFQSCQEFEPKVEKGPETEATEQSSKLRVIVSSDIGGNDPDDFQSMVHILMYANDLDIEGLISSPPHQGRAHHIHDVIDAYEYDYGNLKDKGYPEPDKLRRVVKQGALGKAPASGYSNATEGSRWIVERAKVEDDRPLYIIVWGSITDVAQAVHDHPEIKSKIRVYFIAWSNYNQDRASSDYLYKNHKDMWWIYNNNSYKGIFVGGDQSGDLSNKQFPLQHIKGHGALGDFFMQKKKDLKMGDSPSVLYLLHGDPSNPETESWGGKFVRDKHGPNFWIDDTNSATRDVQNGRILKGAKTISKHREAFLRDWQKRMDYLK